MRKTFHSRGNIELLSQRIVAVYGSREAPSVLEGDVALAARNMAMEEMTVAGGWQSRLEKCFLSSFVRVGRGYLISYAARKLEDRALSPAMNRMLDEKRLLQVAPDVATIRPTVKTVARRDALLLEQCHVVLFLYLAPGGQLAMLFEYLLAKGFPVYVLDHAFHRTWLKQGGLPFHADDTATLL